ncbi:MAG: hypothetical protein Q8R88_12270 [Desulfoprunum sp.]|nr:hypothetical protein [Desulfoprunum sp.]
MAIAPMGIAGNSHDKKKNPPHPGEIIRTRRQELFGLSITKAAE